MKKAGMVTGTFDPITVGHLDIIKRATILFDILYVVLLENSDKSASFSDTDRLQMIKMCVKNLPNVEVMAYDGLAIDIAKRLGVSHFVRGVRNQADFEYEVEMRDWNFAHGEIETLFLPANDELRTVSSTTAKLQIENGDFSLLPTEIVEFVKQGIDNENSKKTI